MRAKQIRQALKPLQQNSSQVFLGQGLHTLGLLGWILGQTGLAQVAVTTFSTSDAFLLFGWARCRVRSTLCCGGPYAKYRGLPMGPLYLSNGELLGRAQRGSLRPFLL